MLTAENVNELMKDIGPVLELYEVTASTEEPGWTLAWNDGTVVAADLDGETGRLTLTTEVGAMPDNQPATSDLLLRYNALWHETGGMRMGVADGQVVQIYDLLAAELDLPTLATILTNFADKARAWSGVLERGPVETPAAGTEAIPLEEILRTGIRA